ncbi:alpha/beta fold hydrolase [Actinomadura xylanilytica]|uniref:alpha/beta fold hydrolase n=1 Tax=Actinomadura xylanilytica TaxID=887459 RepID=UPI00255AF73D|nr:alpha/beta hydrolase [Actinomadura xylanilytica]MDL4777340.1 alpha/beta hydrolase [Actinomadura xylanilytica]
MFDPSFLHGTVPIDDGFLHYVIGGTGPALVMMHGWPETWWEFRKVMPELARTHTVIAFDMPGMGDSSVQADGYDTKTQAARMHLALNRLGFGEVKLLAHDQGAVTGYVWARDHPGEVTRLVVLDSVLNGFGLEDLYGKDFHFLLNMEPHPVPEEIITDASVAMFHGNVFRKFARHPERIDIQHYIDAYMDPARRSAGYKIYRSWAANAEDIRANAESKRLSQPVLAIGGEHMLALDVAKSFRHVAGNVRGVVVPDAGHWPQEENPQFVIDCAKLFFGPAGVPAPSPALANCVA